MWKKIFESGIALGAISICLLFGSHLIFTYDLNAYGLDLKTGDTIGAVGAFGVSIAVGVMAISAFCHYYFLERNAKKKFKE